MEPPKSPLPKSWSATVCAAIVHAISLARFFAIHTPRTLVAGQLGDECELVVEFVEGRRHLPGATLERAA